MHNSFKTNETSALSFRKLNDAYFSEYPYACLDEADVLVITPEWLELTNLDLTEVKKRMRSLLIFDGRNLLDPEKVRVHGIEYHSISRPNESRAAQTPNLPPVAATV